MRRLGLSLLLQLAVLPAVAQDKPTVLLMDDSVLTVFGARDRLDFERYLVGQEEGASGPGSTGMAMLGSAGAVVFGGLGGAIGAGIGDAVAQERRNGQIQALRTQVEQDRRLHGAMLAAIRREAAGHGLAIDDNFLSQDAVAGAVAKFGKPGGAALTVAGDDLPVVMLSWDDRNPLLSLEVRRYRMSRTGTGLLPREQAARKLRFIGLPAPRRDDAVAYWAADGAKRFMAEIDIGLAAVLPLAWNEDDLPSVKRRERVTLHIGGQDFVFPGRLWKQEGGLAYLLNSDEGITVVHTQVATEIGAEVTTGQTVGGLSHDPCRRPTAPAGVSG